MRQPADDVCLLGGFPPDAINVYPVRDVLVDAGIRPAGRRILRQLSGRTVSAHALTHAHPDYQQWLQEGDTVAGFTVLDAPGHSAGHLAYWRESDRTLICGDVFNNTNVFTGIPGLHEPPAMFTPDPARNRESVRRLAALEPRLVCFGHGPPLRDPAELSAFASTLPG